MPYHPEALTHPHVGGGSTSTATTLPPWDPVHLTPQHVEMIKQHVHGIPASRIRYNFKRFGVEFSQRQIGRVLQSQKGREFASFYSAQVHGGTAGLTYHGALYAPEAMYTEVDIMRNPLAQERHRLAASQDLMDRVGPPKISRQENTNPQPTTIVVNLLPSQVSQFLTPPAQVDAEVVLLPEPPSSHDD